MSKFAVFRKQPIHLNDRYEIPCIMSHWVPTEAEALRYQMALGLGRNGYVMSESQFNTVAPLKNLNAWRLSTPLDITTIKV